MPGASGAAAKERTEYPVPFLSLNEKEEPNAAQAG